MIFLLFLFFPHKSLSQSYIDTAEVWVDEGRLVGQEWLFDQKRVQIFKGVPYAEPPLGENRFKRPVRKKDWKGDYNATQYAAPCLQFMDFHQHDKHAQINMKMQSEDCLYLNIFAPINPEDHKAQYPALVWIHGGSFLAGSGDVGVDDEVAIKNLVFNGVILVTINYRLGPLGFLSYKKTDGLREGNFGLWDQLMALSWLKRNLHSFGGDPSRIVVMGESAGAACVSSLALSPLSKELLSGAIIMSGSSTAGWAIHRHGEPEWDLNNMVRYLKCEKKFDEEDVKEILKVSSWMSEVDENYEGERDKDCNLLPPDMQLDCLPAEFTDDSQEQTLDCLRNSLNFSSYLFRKGLTVELGVSKLVVDGELVPFYGDELVKNYSHLPIMIGVAKNEWSHKKSLYYGFKNYKQVEEEEAHMKISAIIESSYRISSESKLKNSTLDLIGNSTFYEYFQSTFPNESWDIMSFVKRLQDLEADIEFVAPCQKEADLYASNGLPVYLYYFSYVPDVDIVETEVKNYNLFGQHKSVEINRKLRFKKAFHGLDHGYIFTRGYSSNFQVSQYSQKDEEMAKRFCELLTNFVKNSNPTPEPLWKEAFLWPAYNSSTGEGANHVELELPPVAKKGQLNWPKPSFWNRHVPKLVEYGTAKEWTSKDTERTLTPDKKMELEVYRRAWYALWLLVAAIVIALWILIICCVLKKCSGESNHKPYGQGVLVTNNR